MLYLREATKDDRELMMAWRSNPLIYQGFYQQQKPLEWNEHLDWLESRNKDWRTFIIVLDERRIGVVTIMNLDSWIPEIGYYVGETSLWNKGYGCKAVELVLEHLKELGKEYVRTTVLKTNKASLRLLEKLGFKILGDAREGEIWLTKKL